MITVKNYELTDIKRHYRQFTKSHIEAFTWDGLGLAPRWKTQTISGYIQDFTIGDFDNVGQNELVAAAVLNEGRGVLVAEPKSTIIAIELSKPEKPE